MSATATETFEFAVSRAPSVTVRNKAGSVTVTAAASGQVRVVATKRAHGGILGMGAGDPERVRVIARQDGDTVSLDVDYDDAGFVKNVTVDFEIAVPADASIEIDQNAGDVRVAGTTGHLRVSLNAGNVRAEGVALAGAARVRNNAGNLDIDGRLAPDASLDATVNAGNIHLRLPAGTPATLDARTTAGSIHVSGGRVTVAGFVGRTATGALGPNPTASIRLKTDAGTITVVAE